MSDRLTDEYYHHQRVCLNCGYTWWGLHCPHDGYQNPCKECDWTPEPVIGSEKCRCVLVMPAIELPEKQESMRTHPDATFVDGYNAAIDEIEQAIKKGGLS